MTDSRVSAKQLLREFGDVRRNAHRAPVVVTHYGRDDLVLMSSDHYEALVSGAPRAWAANELPPRLLELLETQEVPDEPPLADDAPRRAGADGG